MTTATKYTRPANPGTLAIVPRLQRRTARSFETEPPPDRLVTWLCDQGFRIIPKSNNAAEFARLGRGRSPDGRPPELAIVYWSGSIVVGGSSAETVAALLASITEPAPATACMFDTLAEADGGVR